MLSLIHQGSCPAFISSCFLTAKQRETEMTSFVEEPLLIGCNVFGNNAVRTKLQFYVTINNLKLVLVLDLYLGENQSQAKKAGPKK